MSTLAERGLNPLDLTGKTILVTGASRGIGRATAIYLSRLGARIVAVARNAEALAETVSQLAGIGHRAESVDLGQIDPLPAWMKTLAQERDLCTVWFTVPA
jgi:NAD(P)-dependent dehydrogenase (short-subunit alcohol dehydrogenase family)